MIRRTRSPLTSAAALALAVGAALPGLASAQAAGQRPTPHVIQFGTPKPGLPSVRVVGIGGTIVSAAVGRDRWQSYGGEGINDSILISRVMPELGEVDVKLVWSPAWSPEMMSEEARDELEIW